MQFLKEPVALREGENVSLQACHTPNRVFFRVGDVCEQQQQQP